jgi:hypothetical protein
MSFFGASTPGNGSGGVSFNPMVQVVKADGSILNCPMNLSGGFYEAKIGAYDDDDAGSLDFGRSEVDDDGMTFMDAVQNQINEDDEMFPMSVGGPDDTYFQSFRLVFMVC